MRHVHFVLLIVVLTSCTTLQQRRTALVNVAVDGYERLYHTTLVPERIELLRGSALREAVGRFPERRLPCHVRAYLDRYNDPIGLRLTNAVASPETGGGEILFMYPFGDKFKPDDCERNLFGFFLTGSDANCTTLECSGQNSLNTTKCRICVCHTSCNDTWCTECP